MEIISFKTLSNSSYCLWHFHIVQDLLFVGICH
jgi:hypothetical protein